MNHALTGKPALTAALAILLACGTATVAHAAASVIGGSNAHTCYRAAKSEKYGKLELDACDKALDEEVLSQRDRAATFVNRGIIRMHMRQLDPAIADFRSAIELRDDLGESFVNLGIALVYKKQDEAALLALDRGLSLNPTNAHVGYYTRGMVYELLGNAAAAFADYQRAAELAPDWDEPKAQLSRFRVISRPRMTA